jgi:hypothetical protein
MTSRSLAFLLSAMLFAFAAPAAHAHFHLMQIEQAIGGVDGDASAQAIQLRMRFQNQEHLRNARLVVYDATGRNGIVLLDFLSGVASGAQGDRILIASPGFSAHTAPEAVPDYLLANLIPPAYLAAGSLTYEIKGLGLVLWRLSWGGVAYTGGNLGLRFNDQNTDFGPPVPGPLPSTGAQALEYLGVASDNSTSNAIDYGLTSGPAVFTNNAGDNFSVTP